jgi:hypothetical protein
MSDDAQVQPTRQELSEQLMDIATEVSMLRESITTAAEWDLQARTDRQQVLDQTLATVRRGQRALVTVNLILTGTNLALLALVVWLLARVGG